MSTRMVTSDLLISELEFTSSRSSGPGGQNVNKVNSKVTVRWGVKDSQILTPEEKEIIVNKLASKLTIDGVLILSAQNKRSQLDNKEEVVRKLNHLLKNAFVKKKKRKATKPSKSSAQNRLEKKKKHSDKKKLRQDRF